MNLARRSKELPETAKTILKKTRMEVENEGLKLSVTVGGKEGKSEAIVFVEVFRGEIPRMQQHELAVFS